MKGSLTIDNNGRPPFEGLNVRPHYRKGYHHDAPAKPVRPGSVTPHAFRPTL